MQINFRQGIINAQTTDNFIQLVNGNVNINVNITKIDLAFTYGSHDYLFTEAEQVLSAWSGFPTSQTAYLYWDIDLLTGIRTFGFTVTPPTFGSTFPTTPSTNQHFFNFTSNKMFVWSGSNWSEKLRVFAGNVENNAILTPYGLGSQVNLYGQINLGYILYNSQNKPLRVLDGSNVYYFLTTEDEVHIQQDLNNAYKIDALLMDGRAIEPIPAFNAITWKGPKQLGVASYIDYTRPCIGISIEPSGKDEVKRFVTKGFLTNYNNWNFSEVPNTPLFVGDMGQITTTVPQKYSLQKIGHIVSPNTIFVDINEIVLIETIEPLSLPSPSVTPTMSPSPTPTITPTVTPTITPTVTPTVQGIPPYLARLNSDGTVDNTFIDLHLNSSVNNMVFMNDGNVIVGNFIQSNETTYRKMMVLDDMGVVDTNFIPFDIDNKIETIFQNTSDEFFVGGFFTNIPETSETNYYAFAPFKFNYNSNLVDVNKTIARLIEYSDEDVSVIAYGPSVAEYGSDIYVGGTFNITGSDSWSNFARINGESLIVDDTFAPIYFDQKVNTICVADDDTIYVGGMFHDPFGNDTYPHLMRLNSTGVPDTTFTDIQINGPVFVVYKTVDGKLYVGGNFTNTSSDGSKSYLLRLNSDGTVDSTFSNIAIDDSVTTIHQDIDDKIYIGGTFTKIDDTDCKYLLRLNSDGTLDDTFTPLTTFSGVTNTIGQDINNNNTIYVGSDGSSPITALGELRSSNNSEETIDFAVTFMDNSLCDGVVHSPEENEFWDVIIEWAVYSNNQGLKVTQDELCMNHYTSADEINASGIVYVGTYNPNQYGIITDGNCVQYDNITKGLIDYMQNPCRDQYLIVKFKLRSSNAYIQCEFYKPGTVGCG